MVKTPEADGTEQISSSYIYDRWKLLQNPPCSSLQTGFCLTSVEGGGASTIKPCAAFFFHRRQSFTLLERVQRKGFTLTDGLTNTWDVWSIMIVTDWFRRTRALLISRDYSCVSLCEGDRNFIFRNDSLITASHVGVLPHTQLQKEAAVLWKLRVSGAWSLGWAWLLAHRWASSSLILLVIHLFSSPFLKCK